MKSKNDFLITLGELLDGREISSENIYRAMELICDTFQFETSLVYELDQFNSFNLKESFVKIDRDFVQKFDLEEIKLEHRDILANSNLFFISDDDKIEYEKSLLDFLPGKNMILLPLSDNNKKICGLVAFINYEASNAEIIENNRQILTVASNFLCQYINIRIYQNKMNFARISLESILDNTGIDIYVNDFHNHDILYVNRSMAAPYGGIEKFINKKCWEVLFPNQKGQCEFCPQKNLIDENGEPTNIYTWDYQRAFDGSWFRVFSAAFRWVDGRIAHVVSSADITDNKRNEELINYMANYDSLTTLPNRRKLITDCEFKIKEDEKNFVLFFDIDGFKSINDDYGHECGDEFLVNLGTFFTGIPMLNGHIYRNGGDEFVAIIDGKHISKQSIITLFNFIHERFKKPWILSKGNVFCNISVGIACYPEDGNTPEELLNKADQAMYYVKKNGGGAICFAEDIIRNGANNETENN